MNDYDGNDRDFIQILYGAMDELLTHFHYYTYIIYRTKNKAIVFWEIKSRPFCGHSEELR